MHDRASYPAIFGGGEALGGLYDQRQRSELFQPAAPGIHGLTFHRRDAATHPPGKRITAADLTRKHFMPIIYTWIMMHRAH